MHLWPVVCFMILLQAAHCHLSREFGPFNKFGKSDEFVPGNAPQTSVEQQLPVDTPSSLSLGARLKRGATCGVDSELTDDEKVEIVNAHNDVRRIEGADQLMLEWDDNLAARAQEWANDCTFVHNMLSDCSGNAVGQNGYAKFGTSTVNLTRSVEAWAFERNYWNFTSGSCLPGQLCGHWVQLIWSRSRLVGCGYAFCETLYGDPDDYGTPTVLGSDAVSVFCDYSPPGNVVGATMFTPGQSCASCLTVTRNYPNTPGYMCPNKLCIPCSPVQDPVNCTCGPNVSCLNGGKWNVKTCKCDCTVQANSTLADPNYYYGLTCNKLCSDKGTVATCTDYKKKGYCTPDWNTYMKAICPKTCRLCA